jgi:hypothetical protein
LLASCLPALYLLSEFCLPRPKSQRIEEAENKNSLLCNSRNFHGTRSLFATNPQLLFVFESGSKGVRLHSLRRSAFPRNILSGVEAKQWQFSVRQAQFHILVSSIWSLDEPLVRIQDHNNDVVGFRFRFGEHFAKRLVF